MDEPGSAGNIFSLRGGSDAYTIRHTMLKLGHVCLLRGAGLDARLPAKTRVGVR